ncbi:MAG: hypothetical protein J6O39_00130 [Treponema sp.]|nr:hypothetical protein [Treponema sp.]
MNKILKILSILVIGFVMFSCSTPTNDPILYVPEPSGPEVPTYSVIFTIEESNLQIIADYLNSLPEFKNLEEGTEVMLYKHIYSNYACDEFTTEIVETSVYDYYFCYDNNSEIDSVVIGNEDVEVEMKLSNATQFRDN